MGWIDLSSTIAASLTSRHVIINTRLNEAINGHWIKSTLVGLFSRMDTVWRCQHIQQTIQGTVTLQLYIYGRVVSIICPSHKRDRRTSTPISNFALYSADSPSELTQLNKAVSDGSVSNIRYFTVASSSWHHFLQKSPTDTETHRHSEPINGSKFHHSTSRFMLEMINYD